MNYILRCVQAGLPVLRPAVSVDDGAGLAAGVAAGGPALPQVILGIELWQSLDIIADALVLHSVMPQPRNSAKTAS
jgi:hypothetical protein